MNEIKAICNKHAVLQNGQIQTIGYIADKKRYTGTGRIVPTKVVFHFGASSQDCFYFENNTLVYHAVSLSTPEYLCDIYADYAASPNVSPSEFISKVTAIYVFTTLGF